jgi:hypothetical protein
MSAQARRGGPPDEEAIEFSELDPRRRATLLESEAEELRARLDALLAELGRQRRRTLPDGQIIGRYALGIAVGLAAAGAGMLLWSWRRQRRQMAAWRRLLAD